MQFWICIGLHLLLELCIGPLQVLQRILKLILLNSLQLLLLLALVCVRHALVVNTNFVKLMKVGAGMTSAAVKSFE